MSPGGHHHSHRKLIAESPSMGDRAPVDAIIVPSARYEVALREAGRLAAELGCVLVVLSSKHSSAGKVVDFLAGKFRIDVVAVDFPTTGIGRLPVLETSTILDRSRLRRRTDTSAKRNLGLVLARIAGWKRVIFLDDDITVPDATDLERAVARLNTCDGVGLRIEGFPDNSVVCHANRETGAPQDTFLGGGAMAVATDRVDAFFPEIYNEDWFFLLDGTMLRPVGQVGVALQKPYDPFANPGRARDEEFGDVLAEGLFALFDDGGKIGDATHGYWAAFLEARGDLINAIKARIESKGSSITARDEQMLESLRAAHGRLQIITPGDCVKYIGAWQRDGEAWRRFLSGVRPIRRPPDGQQPIDVALARVGLEAVNRPRHRSAQAPAGRRRESVAAG